MAKGHMSVDLVLMEDVWAVDTADQLVLQPRSCSTLIQTVQYTILCTHVAVSLLYTHECRFCPCERFEGFIKSVKNLLS